MRTLPLDLEEEPDSRTWHFLRRDEDALDGPGISTLEGTRDLWSLGFSLGEGGSMVLSEAAPDSAASEAEIGAGAGVVIATGAPVNRTIRKTEN